MIEIDLTSVSDTDLSDLIQRAYAEDARRRTISTAQEKTEQIAQEYARAIGREDGAEWKQPTGAHDAYTLGAVVSYNGATYRSTIPANVWAPDAYPAGWEVITDHEPTPQPDATDWSGSSVSYEVGDLVTYNGVVYSVLQAHTSQAGWTPDAVPSLYVVA